MKRLIKYSKRALDAVYPRRCPVCHEIVTPRGGIICRTCKAGLRPIAEPRCKKCGKELSSANAEYCYDCNTKAHHFDQGLGIFPYNPIMKESIMQFKYHGRKEYGQFYGLAMAYYGRDQIRKFDPEVMIPVPIHKKRLKKRGFNQAEVIAKWAGKAMGIPVDTNIIFRIQETAPQKELSSKDRKRNLEKAFCIPDTLTWKRILIIDDIYTTGSTIDAMSKCLKQKGADKVYFLSVCEGGGF